MRKPRHQILVVDDNREFCQLMRDFLTRINYDIIVFNSVEEAVTSLKSRQHRQVDLIITELHFRRTTPAEALSLLQPFGVPIIVVTSLDGRPGSANEHGVAGYLVKPFPLSEIAALVDGELKKVKK